MSPALLEGVSSGQGLALALLLVPPHTSAPGPGAPRKLCCQSRDQPESRSRALPWAREKDEPPAMLLVSGPGTAPQDKACPGVWVRPRSPQHSLPAGQVSREAQGPGAMPRGTVLQESGISHNFFKKNATNLLIPFVVSYSLPENRLPCRKRETGWEEQEKHQKEPLSPQERRKKDRKVLTDIYWEKRTPPRVVQWTERAIGSCPWFLHPPHS